MPETNEPIRWLTVVTTATTSAAVAARSGMSYRARRLTSCARHRVVAVTGRSRNGDGEHDRVERERAAGVHSTSRNAAAAANQTSVADTDAEHDAVPLRQHGIGEREDRDRRIRREAADRAGGDEGRRVLQRQDDIGRARRRRQRGDQRADERAAALDRNRGHDHDGRRHRHLESELVPEQRIGGHRPSPVMPGSTRQSIRKKMDAQVKPGHDAWQPDGRWASATPARASPRSAGRS